ncbi:uncharacterized protein LOC121405840 [Lytechinus variegatus]|uniref:uncharacterized protein LOC121405840 n=1 Tax=Lytechinus variegatus TaxID=7654 RepID=UPI001BB2CB60|nr:uncharacterized protein LOC121405840 [Lytechinus variegatus]
MGACNECLFGAREDYEDVDPETKRRQQAEAAEKRFTQQESRGLKDPEGVKRKLQQKEEAERKAARVEDTGGQGGLKWQVSS